MEERKAIYSYDEIEKVYKKNKQPFYYGKFNLNVGAIRTAELNTNKFRCIEFVAYMDEKLRKVIELFPCTTVPGFLGLTNPVNEKGTFIMKPGFYRHLWSPGLHRGKPALVQINKVSGYRDNDRDKIIDIDPKTIDTGMFGINNHACRWDRIVENVDNWSEGCVAVPNCKNMMRLLELVAMQNKYGYGEKVSFMLFSPEEI